MEDSKLEPCPHCYEARSKINGTAQEGAPILMQESAHRPLPDDPLWINFYVQCRWCKMRTGREETARRAINAWNAMSCKLRGVEGAGKAEELLLALSTPTRVEGIGLYPWIHHNQWVQCGGPDVVPDIEYYLVCPCCHIFITLPDGDDGFDAAFAKINDPANHGETCEWRRARALLAERGLL